MPTPGGVGQFISWNGGCLFIGREVGLVPTHSHYAIQIAFGKEPGLAFRSSDADDWREYRGAMIPSRQPHSMDARKLTANAVMFVEPETREGKVIAERLLASGIAPLPEAALAETGRVFEAWEAGEQRRLVEACLAVIGALTGDIQPAQPSDARILRAVDYVNANLDKKLTLEEVAEAAFLSPSRFRHLFVEETGMALRPYILWRRFLKVWALMMEGESLSRAAHAAGFADAAHLSRTSKRMFGFPPTSMRVRSSSRLHEP